MTDLKDLRTLGSIERRAKEVLDPAVWAFGYYGSYSGETFERNKSALRRWAIEQRTVVDVRHIDITANFCGTVLPSPVIVAPMGGMVSFHEMGDLEIARGANQIGAMATVSGRSAFLPDEMGQGTPGPLIYQLYYAGDNDWIARRLAQVQEYDVYKAITVTVTVAAHGQRDGAVDTGRLPATKHQTEQLPDRFRSASLTWSDVEWMRKQITRLPFGLKGIFTVDDARRCLDVGLDYIWVSNHGGRQLDGGRASIDVLQEIAEAIAGRVPLIVDGGFSRGADVIKGLALGATLVGMARMPVWGLAVGGAEGVAHTLHMINEELEHDLALAGETCASKLTPKILRKVDY